MSFWTNILGGLFGANTSQTLPLYNTNTSLFSQALLGNYQTYPLNQYQTYLGPPIYQNPFYTQPGNNWNSFFNNWQGLLGGLSRGGGWNRTLGQTSTQMWDELPQYSTPPGKTDNYNVQDFYGLIKANVRGDVNNQQAIDSFLRARPFLGLSMADVFAQPEAVGVSGGGTGTRGFDFAERLAMAIMQKADKAYVPVSGGIAKDGTISRAEFFEKFPAGAVGGSNLTQLLNQLNNPFARIPFGNLQLSPLSQPGTALNLLYQNGFTSPPTDITPPFPPGVVGIPERDGVYLFRNTAGQTIQITYQWTGRIKAETGPGTVSSAIPPKLQEFVSQGYTLSQVDAFFANPANNLLGYKKVSSTPPTYEAPSGQIFQRFKPTTDMFSRVTGWQPLVATTTALDRRLVNIN